MDEQASLIGSAAESGETNASSAHSHGSTDETSPETLAASSGTKAFNCVVCKNRKVKCDRGHPCSTCTKLNVECQYIEPGPRKKRKASAKQESLMQRLNRYEDLLKQVETNVKLLDNVEGGPGQGQGTVAKEKGLAPFDPDAGERQAKRTKILKQRDHEFSTARKGGLLAASGSSGGRYRYYENNLWNSLNVELQELKESILDSSDDEGAMPACYQHQGEGYPSPYTGAAGLFVGLSWNKVDLTRYHPPAAHAVLLWQHFLENVNPLCQIIHHPSLGKELEKYREDPKHMPKNLEAIVFSIYSLTTLSLDSRQCLQLFQEKKAKLLARYRLAATSALKNAGTLKTSDIAVIQALTLFLLDMRSYTDSRSFWVLTGCAIRIAQRAGLHRDGSKLNLPPFETELRRRLWREIMILDFRAAELSGAGLYTMSIDEKAWDTQTPLNLNEEDIWPGMTEPPQPRIGPTDSIWCGIRSELGNVFIAKWRMINRGPPRANCGEKDLGDFYKALDNDYQVEVLSKMLEEKYLRYCDPVKPLQLFTSIVGRSAITNLRLMTNHPIRRADNGGGMSQEQRDNLFNDSVRVIEYDNLCHSTRSIQRFLWHTKNFFQWHAFIHLLGELRSTKLIGADVENAWRQIDDVFGHHQEWLDRKDELHVAITSFAWKAWESREALVRRKGLYDGVEVPRFVKSLRETRDGGVPHGAGVTTDRGAGSGDAGRNAKFEAGYGGNMANVAAGIGDMMVERIGMAGVGSAPCNAGMPDGMMNPLGPGVSMAGGSASGTPAGQSSVDMSPINWSEWDHLLQSSDLMGFSGAFDISTGAAQELPISAYYNIANGGGGGGQ